MVQPYAPPRDPTAVLGRRLAAFLIDLFFLGVIGVIVLASASHRSLYGAPKHACASSALRDSSLCFQISDHLWAFGRTAVVQSAVLFVIAIFLDLVVLQAFTGASVGKLCVGLRVVEVQGNEARFLRVLGRTLFLVIDLGFIVVGVITTLVTRPHRRVGDLVCGTYVVGIASVGQPIVVPDLYPPVQSTTPSAYGAPPGAPVPPGWGSPTGWATVPPPAPIPTPPGTSPTTPGEWGAVARPGPAVVRAPQWEAPPPGERPPVPVARDTMAPQWATPPGPISSEPADAEQAAMAEPMVAPDAAPEPLAEAPPWSPVVPLTTKDAMNGDEARANAIEPPPPPPSPWSPVVPASGGDPTPPSPTEPPPPAPTEPPPPAPTEPSPPPAAQAPPEPEPEPLPTEPERDDDTPWWDSGS